MTVCTPLFLEKAEVLVCSIFVRKVVNTHRQLCDTIKK